MTKEQYVFSTRGIVTYEAEYSLGTPIAPS